MCVTSPLVPARDELVYLDEVVAVTRSVLLDQQRPVTGANQRIPSERTDLASTAANGSFNL